MKYSLIEVDSFKFVKIDNGLLLIDTGSPFSYFKNEKIIIDDKVYKNSAFQKILKLRMEEFYSHLKDKLNDEIIGLIGMDIISGLGITINKKEDFVSFDSIALTDGVFLEFELEDIKNQKYIIFKDIDVVGMTKEGLHSFILDTGSVVNVFKNDLCAHAQYAYRMDYYYPSFGRTLTSDFMFFTLKSNNTLNVIAGANIDYDMDMEFEFLNVDGELCFNDFAWDILSIHMGEKRIYWK